MKKTNKGFSLVELITVIAIMTYPTNMAIRFTFLQKIFLISYFKIMSFHFLFIHLPDFLYFLIKVLHIELFQVRSNLIHGSVKNKLPLLHK